MKSHLTGTCQNHSVAMSQHIVEYETTVFSEDGLCLFILSFSVLHSAVSHELVL